jgi:hypothetical protein
MREIWISPSDLTFFFNDSKIGFYDKYIMNIQRPKNTFPALFATIDQYMKNSFDLKNCQNIVKDAPSGILTHNDIDVQSKLITLGDYKVGFKGKMDCIMTKSDGNLIVVDYKTAFMSPKLRNVYFLQLMSYAFCLENPYSLRPKKVDGLGLIVFHPDDFSFDGNSGEAGINGSLKWVEIPFDKSAFKDWINLQLKPLLNAKREDLYESATDKDWNRYIGHFYVEREEVSDEEEDREYVFDN